MRRIVNLTAGAALLGLGAFAGVHAAIPERPEQIEFKPLEFQPPKPSEFRRELSSGVPVYMAPSDEFPLVNISFSFKGGSYLEPADKVGLANMTGAMIRRGGTATVPAEQLDEQFDFLAAQAGAFSGDLQSGANLNCLKSNLDESFGLFMDMLKNPGFQEDKVRVYKDEVIEALKQRNDDAGPILSREWAAVMYGRDHFSARQPTLATIESITIDDLKAFHQKVFQPGNLIIAVTGDFKPDEMMARLESALSGWAKGERMPDPPEPSSSVTPGVYRVEKDIPQGKVYIGMRGVTRDDPDYFPLLVMNDILGGGGFTSRITKRVRSDEGLAYSAGSAMIMPVYYPGEYRASFQSKNRTVALAAKIVFEEVERMRTEPVGEKELETAKNSFVETFPRTFESKAAMLNVFVSDEWTGRDPSYWQNYRDNIRAVTADDVRRVAEKHLDPDKMAFMIVGKWTEIEAGDLEGRARMADFFDGSSLELPLRDPLTLEPIR